MRGCFLVTNYNKQTQIAECLKSLLNQKYHDDLDITMDIIIIDDGSIDYSVDVIRHFEKKYDNIIAYYYSENAGIGIRRNQLLTYAENGEYDFAIVFDSDDIATETLVNNSVNMFEDGGDVFYNSYHHVDYLGEPIGQNFEVEAPDEKDITIEEGAGKQNVSHGGLCIKKDFFHVRYPEVKYGEDHAYLYNLMQAGAEFRKVKVHWNKDHNMLVDAGFFYMRSPDSVSTVHKDEISKHDREFFRLIAMSKE